MSSYKTYIVLILSIFTFCACSVSNSNLENKKVFKKVEHNNYIKENEEIVIALEADFFKDYKKSQYFYEKLFLNTKKYEYLTKAFTSAFLQKDYDFVKINFKNYYIEDIKEEEELLKWYVFSLSASNDDLNAIRWGEFLLEKYNNALSHEIVARVYYDAKMYKKSYSNFEISNNLAFSVIKTSIMANILYNNFNKKYEAKEFLKKSIDIKEYDYTLSLQLLSFYNKDKEFDKSISLMKDMYITYYKNKNSQLLDSVRKLFITFTFRLEDAQNLIAFLEKYNSEDSSLLALYEKSGNKYKALVYLENSYSKSNNLDELAKIAILEFEMAINKKVVLESVIKKFEKVLKEIDNARYQNYLAYILIDFDIDIKKGLLLVNKALEIEPQNVAYLDTKAWGEYKSNNCREAFLIMEKIVKEVGINDEEIKLHWEKIKECIK